MNPITSFTNLFINGDSHDKKQSTEMSFADLSIGCCHYCNKKQSAIGKDGLWILHESDIKWICYECKTKNKKYSYPVACEWCKYDNVKWYQGHTYHCPRCVFLGIKH